MRRHRRSAPREPIVYVAEEVLAAALLQTEPDDGCRRYPRWLRWGAAVILMIPGTTLVVAIVAFLALVLSG